MAGGGRTALGFKWILAGGPDNTGKGFDLLNALVENAFIKYCLRSGMLASIGSYGMVLGRGGGGSLAVVSVGMDELRQDFAGDGKGKLGEMIPSSLQA